MLRRWVVVSFLGLLGLASQARADWKDWLIVPGGPVWVFETGNAPTGPGMHDRCFIIAVTDFVTANNSGEVWCRSAFGTTLMNKIDTVGFASVAMDAPLFLSPSLAAPYYAVSDPASAQVWYGVTGQPPELAVQGTPARSLSLAHFADGTALLVYAGWNGRVYLSTRDPQTSQWKQMQLTNNSTGFNRWSVDAVIESGVVHITYWDADWQAVRYARRRAGAWTFETVKNVGGSPSFVSPAVAGDDEGGAYVAFALPDGLLHYLQRTGPATWTEHTFAPPLPASYDADRGPVGFTVGHRKLAHFVYGTGNWGDPDRVLRYVNASIDGVWRDSTVLQVMTNEPEGYRGIDLVRKGALLQQQLLASWASAVVGILELGCSDCIP